MAMLLLALGVRSLLFIRTWSVARLHRAAIARASAASLRGQLADSNARHALAELERRRVVFDSNAIIVRGNGEIGPRVASLLRDVATANGAVMQSMQPRTESSQTSPLLASVRLTMTCDLIALAGFVRDLESSGPIVRIADMALTQTTVADTDETPDVLKVDMTVQALVLVRTSTTDARRN